MTKTMNFREKIKELTDDKEKTKMPWKQRVIYGAVWGSSLGGGFGLMYKEAVGDPNNTFIYCAAIVGAVLIGIAGFFLKNTNKPLYFPEGG